MTRRRSAHALVALGVGCLLSAALPAVRAGAAGSDPGSGLGSFSLAASAPAVQLRVQEPTYCFATPAATNGCELVLPEAVATLRNGPIGTALSSVLWPGSLAANAGSLLITASNGQVPDSARALNDPVKAEARTSTGPDTVTYDSVPGTTMKAVAKDDVTSAEATVAPLQATPLGTFGATTGSSSSRLTGPSTAVSTARSSVQDVDLAGVLHLDAVTSEATATTDGSVAKATGRTVVTGATVQGVPVTIDDRGVTVAGTTTPLAAAAVEDALKQAGLTVQLVHPTGKPDGASVTYNAGALVVMWAPQTGYAGTAVLGGANVSVVASKALDFSLPAVDVSAFTPPSAGAPVPGGSAPVPSLGGQVDAPAPSLPGPVTAGAPPATGDGPSPVLAAQHAPLPAGLPAWWVLLGLVGVALVAAGLRRLPAAVLAAGATACPLEEDA